MARGYPDYFRSIGKTAEGQFLPQQAGGNIFFSDDFESPPFKWVSAAGTASHYSGAEDTDTFKGVFNGSGSLKLLSQSGDEGTTYRYLGAFPVNSQVSISLYFTMPDYTQFVNDYDSLMLLAVEYDDTLNNYYFKITMNVRTGAVYYLDSTETPILLGVIGLGNDSWNYAKLIVDPINHKYIKLILNSTEFDMSSYSYVTGASEGSSYSIVYIGNKGDTAQQAELFVDEIKLVWGES